MLVAAAASRRVTSSAKWTVTVQTDECGQRGAMVRVPAEASRTADMPAGVDVPDPVRFPNTRRRAPPQRPRPASTGSLTRASSVYRAACPKKRLRVLTIYATFAAINRPEETVTYDVIIRDGLWFDGTGSAPHTRTLGIRDGVVATVSAGPLDETGCPEVIDAAGKWIVPGFIDVHTHYDAEVLLDPGLRESVRHGVTTVLLGNCSLSTVYADSEDAADLFSRVEAVPREYVFGALESNRTWSTAAEYIEAIDALPLGPNVGSLLGHSDLRTAVLGLERATDDTVRPTDAELEKMAALLEEALDAGMLGMSGHGRGHRQTRRRPLSLARAAVHLRDLAGTAQADQGAAQARPDAAERARRREPGVGD